MSSGEESQSKKRKLEEKEEKVSFAETIFRLINLW